MLVTIKVNFYSFAAILGICAYFFWGVFSYTGKLREARALTQPIETLQIESGYVQEVRKVDRMNLFFLTTKLSVHYGYEKEGRVKTYKFECRSVPACHWLKEGPAEIVVTKDGRYALPAELRDQLRPRLRYLKGRLRIGGIMSLLTLGLSGFWGFQLFRQ